uniref:Protein YIPF n=1 Tax=Timema cristinae TaxID=61476 RepID=A0A7R9D7H0_TIMCR|nr:unnamed protein product [Timema cristinae]
MSATLDERERYANAWYGYPDLANYSFDTSDVRDFGQPGQLNFQSYEGAYGQQGNNPNFYPTENRDAYSSTMSNMTPSFYSTENMYSPRDPTGVTQDSEFDQEPPLLEELGIDPDRIVEKTMTVLNPFRKRGPTDDANFLLSDADLAGPVSFCLAMAACLLLGGGKAHFGYVYGLALISCACMYALLNLMSNGPGPISVASVASVLGYCLLPVVGLTALGVFLPLRSAIGMGLSALVVLWCSLSASRLFVTMSADTKQRPLFAYPCVLIYSVFTSKKQTLNLMEVLLRSFCQLESFNTALLVSVMGDDRTDRSDPRFEGLKLPQGAQPF